MLNEYAIEPQGFFAENGVWQKHGDLGVAQGRIIAEFGSTRWVQEASRDLAANYQKLGTRAFKKLEEWLVIAAKEGVIRRRIAHSPHLHDETWTFSAMRENEVDRFKAIICRDPEVFTNCDNAIAKTDLDLDHELWKTKKTIPVMRTIESIAAAARPLARYSQDLLFVDPYFGFRANEYGSVAKIIADAQNATYPIRLVEVHTVAKNGQTPQLARTNICDHFPDIMRRYRIINVAIRVKIWKCGQDDDQFHDRFLLTELGGIMFSSGLDKTKKGERKTARAVLLDQPEWLNLMKQYNSRSILFSKPFGDPLEDFEINGKVGNDRVRSLKS